MEVSRALPSIAHRALLKSHPDFGITVKGLLGSFQVKSWYKSRDLEVLVLIAGF